MEPISRPHVVGTGLTDTVHLSALIYKNRYVRKSLSVHHLQRRLTELGFDSAGADIDGTYGDLTRAAVEAFQRKRKLPDADGLANAATITALFKGDPNVTVVID